MKEIKERRGYRIKSFVLILVLSFSADFPHVRGGVDPWHHRGLLHRPLELLQPRIRRYLLLRKVLISLFPLFPPFLSFPICILSTVSFCRNGNIADPQYHKSGDLVNRVGYDIEVQYPLIVKSILAGLLTIADYQ